MSRERSWWIGAYALTSSLSAFSERDAQGFYEKIRNLPRIGGLELPLHRAEKHDDPWRHLHLLPKDLDYILTPLPYVMQSLEQQPLFGLASADPAGRSAALQLMDELRNRIRRLNDHCGRSAVRAVQIHSAPTAQAQADSFRRSLDEVVRLDWDAVELWVEHCDAFQSGLTPAKGFLDINAEISMVQEFSLGMTINWGRSVLETRRAEGALEHLAQARDAGVLRALFLSSVTVQDPIYGNWLDNHAPLQGVGHGAWLPHASLLTRAEVQKALAAAASIPFWGIKIQPGPASLSLADRLQCVREHLEFFSSLESRRAGL
ncbi:MAG: DUF4862 family protein [Pseudobdellovibrionaceae bacterium]|nr:DUF4862 family protein [Pseudobdellovibrionaceae bacterium]